MVKQDKTFFVKGIEGVPHFMTDHAIVEKYVKDLSAPYTSVR